MQLYCATCCYFYPVLKYLFIISVAINFALTFFIAKRFYYSKIPPILWKYDIAMLGDSHIYRANWNGLLNKRVANFGVGGSTVQQMYGRLAGVINCQPKYCFIECGINDIILGVPIDTTLKYYRAILDRLKGIKCYGMEVMVTGDDSLNDRIRILNDSLNNIIPILQAGINKYDLQTDSLHMNGSGYYKWSTVIEKVLER